MKKTQIYSEQNLLYFILIPYLFLVIVHILFSLPMKVPIIWPDEFAYLFFGKYIAGYHHVQQIPKIDLTGSFGYSVLFAPIFKFFDNPQKAYSWILILNSIVGSTLYIGLFLLLKNLFDCRNKQAFWIAFIVSLYPAYLLQTDIVLTDAVTPAFFIFGVLLFRNFIIKKSLFAGLLFALMAGYLNWIHIRMLPFTIISIIFLIALVYYKRMPKFQTGLAIISMLIMILLGIIIGDHLTYVIAGAVDKSQRITSNLIQVAEILLIFLLLGSSLYFMLKKYYLLMVYTLAGMIGGVMASTSTNILWMFPVVGLGFLILLLITKKIQFIYAVWAFTVLIVIACFTYFVLPDFGYYTVVTERIMIWFVNASGSLFYALFSTYSLFLMGVIFMIIHIRNNAIVLVPAVSHTDVFKEVKKTQFSFSKLLENENNLTILFMMAAAFLMIFITIFPYKWQITHYRADHLFYGRYVEVVLAGFMAIAIYKLITSQINEFLIATIGTWTVFIILALTMIITYDNIIPSELSFRSVMSFFPLRAVLGNINIMLFFLASILVSLLISFTFRYNPKIGKIILGSAFLSFTIFTYIYVDYYHQAEKIQRNKLVNFINEYFPEEETISYDKSISSNNSQNGLSYVWLMPERKFNFFSSHDKTPNTDLIIAGSDYGLINNKDAVLLNIEHDGNDFLWLRTSAGNDKIQKELMPSFFDIPLNENFVGGVFRSGLHNDKWINGKAEIITSVNQPDSVFEMEMELISSSAKPHNLIVWLDNKEIFKQDINQGGWKFNLKFKSDSVLKRLHFKFFSDLSKDKPNNSRLIGILLKSFVLKSVKKEKLNLNEQNKFSGNPVPIEEIKYTIYPRRNIDMSQLNLNPGDSVRIPFVIRNNGKTPIVFDDENPVYISHIWRDFIFKSEYLTEVMNTPLTGVINPGKEKEIFITLVAPAEQKKYFLTFVLLSKKQVILKPIVNREYLLNLKQIL